MLQYTTGELARLCGVSVRTVQFYDAKDLLKPAALSEGGRRLYDESGADRLRLIAMLKALGLSLGAIKGILNSPAPNGLLLTLLDEQEKTLGGQISAMEKQMKTIKAIKQSLRDQSALPVNSLSDIERMMESKKKLKKTHAAMLVVGLIMDVIQIGTILLWILKGIWLPFALGMPLVLLMGVAISRMYYKNTAFICAQCRFVFQPGLREFTFSKHTPKTRKLKCPACGVYDYCVETSSDALDA